MFVFFSGEKRLQQGEGFLPSLSGWDHKNDRFTFFLLVFSLLGENCGRKEPSPPVVAGMGVGEGAREPDFCSFLLGEFFLSGREKHNFGECLNKKYCLFV